MENIEDFIEDEIVFKDLRGTFGNFMTSNSFEVYYLMTSINISEIDILKEASSVLKFSEVKFDEIVQRDIDHERVGNIFEEYLDMSSEKVVFFPPLLATLMITKEGKPIDKYEDIQEPIDKKGNRDYLNKVWDNKIKLNLPLSSNDTGHIININNSSKNYINYAAMVSYVEKDVSLVVIDGQHRLKALQKLKEKYPKMKSINVPLCIFFSSNAKDTNESIVQDMRELFVTINNTGKKVSGHFITLLKDKSLSSISVRELSNLWKGQSENYEDCMLYFLEWNQRQEGRANQVTRKYSVTTISILADVLKDYVFHNKKGITRKLLKLDSKKDSLKEGVSYTEISEDNFSLDQIEVLKKQINDNLTPLLNLLFTEALPYMEIIKSGKNAITKLNKKIYDGITGAIDFRDNVLNEFRDLNKFDSDTRKSFHKEFINDIEYNEFFDYFRNNVFQQGYIIAWYKLIKVLNDIEASKITTAYIMSLNKFVFNINKDIFDPRKDFTQQVLYRGQKMIITVGVKEYISNLILATFLNSDVLKTFIDNTDNSIKEKVIEIADEGYNDYFEIFKTKNQNNLKSNYMYDLTLSDEQKQELNRLDIKAKSGTKEDKKNFSDLLSNIIEPTIEESKKIFNNLLELN